MWSSSPAGGFPQSTMVSAQTKTTRTQASVPTSRISVSYRYLFRNRCKINKVVFVIAVYVLHSLVDHNIVTFRSVPFRDSVTIH